MPEVATKTSVTENGITFRLITDKPPTGLAGVAWQWSGYDVTIKYDGITYRMAGSVSIFKRRDGTERWYWSMSSEDGFWDTCNTLNTSSGLVPGKAYSYDTADHAFAALRKWIINQMRSRGLV